MHAEPLPEFVLTIVAAGGIGRRLQQRRYGSWKRRCHRSAVLGFTSAEIGFGAYQKHETPLPAETLSLVRRADATLLGSVATPAGISNYALPVLALQHELDLHACVRPIRSLPGAERAGDIDMVIVRENTEGLYSRRAHATADTAVAESVITRKATRRL